MRGSANIYNLPEHLQARSMCAITADTDKHRFVLGSGSVFPAQKGRNEIHVLNYSEDANRIEVEHTFKVEGLTGAMAPEVTQISSSPYNRNTLLVATQNDTDTNSVLFYQLASESESGEISAHKLTNEFKIESAQPQVAIHSIVWEDHESMEGKTPTELILAD